MFKIGEFARISGVSAKSLRHYDGMALFRPAWVDPDSGYRFYSPAQLPELYRILALKDLGIPLGEVAGLVVGGADLDAALTRRRAEMQDERRALERRLAALDLQVDVDGRSRFPGVVLRRVESELVAALRATMAPGATLEPLFDEIESYVRDQAARAPRPPATLVHASGLHGTRDVEVVIPLIEPIPGTKRISCKTLPAVRVAAAIHRGPYEGLDHVRSTLSDWLAVSGLRATGPARIVYLQFGADPGLRVPPAFLTDSEISLVTEVQQPVG